MNKLVPNSERVFRGIETATTGLTYEHKMSVNLWDELVQHIMLHRSASQWWLGDALNAGDDQFSEEVP